LQSVRSDLAWKYADDFEAGVTKLLNLLSTNDAPIFPYIF